MPGKKVLRFDTAGLALPGLKPPKMRRDGTLRVDGHFTKPGVFPYTDAAGRTIMEYRPSAEVLAPKSMESWQGVPITDGHPADLVTSQTWREHAIGHVGDDVRVDAGKLAASLHFKRKDAVERVVKREMRGLSGGYYAELDDTPGVTAGDPNVPDGIRFDRVQREIEGNHLASLHSEDDARLGRDMTMRLDSRGNQTVRALRTDSERRMKITFNGKTYDLDSEGDRALLNAAIEADEADRKARTDAREALVRERDELKGKVASLETEAAKLPEKIAAGVAARAELEREGREVLGEKFDSKLADEPLKKSIREGMEAAIKAADPTAKLEGEPDAYVRGRYAGIRVDAQRVQQSRSDFRKGVDEATRRVPPSQGGDLELGGLLDRANDAQRRFDEQAQTKSE